MKKAKLTLEHFEHEYSQLLSREVLSKILGGDDDSQNDDSTSSSSPKYSYSTEVGREVEASKEK